MGTAAFQRLYPFSLAYARIDLGFEICERGKTRTLLRAVRLATAERVENVAVK